MRADWGQVAALQRRLAGCAIASMVLSFDGVPLLGVPAALVAAHTFFQFGPLLDRAAARVCMQWAAVAAGGAAAACALGYWPEPRDAASVAVLVATSATVSLYALGLAAWTAPVGDGRPALRLRVSVGLWWVSLTLVALASGRGVGVLEAVVATIPGLVATGLLIHSHMLVRLTMEQLAADDEVPAPV